MRFKDHSRVLVRVAITVLALSWLVSGLAVAESPAAPHTITTIASTVPANGDINPYGIFVARARLETWLRETCSSATSTPRPTSKELEPRLCRYPRAAWSASSP